MRICGRIDIATQRVRFTRVHAIFSSVPRAFDVVGKTEEAQRWTWGDKIVHGHLKCKIADASKADVASKRCPPDCLHT